jgi:hypothetical protein
MFGSGEKTLCREVVAIAHRSGEALFAVDAA